MGGHLKYDDDDVSRDAETMPIVVGPNVLHQRPDIQADFT